MQFDVLFYYRHFILTTVLIREGEKMNNVLGFWSLVIILVYGTMAFMAILVIYVLFLAIKALKIYIQKNS